MANMTAVFQGLRPLLAPHLLDDSLASDARDARVFDGYLRPERTLVMHKALPHAAQTLYRWKATDTWLTWPYPVDVTESPVQNTERVYFTGADAMRVADVNSMLLGVGPYPSTSFRVGVPAPVSAPTVRFITPQDRTPDGSRDYDALDLETRYYVFTYVNQWGEESAPSPVSGRLDCYDDSKVEVTLPVAPAPGYVPVTAVRLYRTATGSRSTGFQFVCEKTLAAAATAFLDEVKTHQLAESLETEAWALPPADLRGLTSLSSGILAGFRGNEVCFSVPYVPYAWPVEFRQIVPDEVVGIAALGADLVVMTRGRPVVIAGATPDAMQQIRVPEMQPCLSTGSICVHDGVVVYACPDGLMGVSGSGEYRLLTREIFARDQWTALGPDQMRCFSYEGRIIAFGSSTIAIDVSSQTYLPLSITGTTAFYSGYDDTFYIAQGASLLKLTGPATRYRWTSKHYLGADRGYASARVHALSYTDLVFRYVVDGTVRLTKSITSAQPFRLPAIRGRRIWFELEGTDPVVSAGIGASHGELLA